MSIRDDSYSWPRCLNCFQKQLPNAGGACPSCSFAGTIYPPLKPGEEYVYFIWEEGRKLNKKGIKENTQYLINANGQTITIEPPLYTGFIIYGNGKSRTTTIRSIHNGTLVNETHIELPIKNNYHATLLVSLESQIVQVKKFFISKSVPVLLFGTVHSMMD